MTKAFPPLTHEAVLEKIAAAIDIPPEIYEQVVSRYQSIGGWLERPNSTIKGYNPYVAPQGSFLIGTANKPVSDTDEIDVDLICRLNASKSEMSQKDLKLSVGKEVIAYAAANNMNHDPENKRRCWTLKYADQRNFHVDVLPCIPDAETYRTRLSQRGYGELADDERITQQAIAITDDKEANYEHIAEDWPTSNPLGYAAWFMQQMAELIRLEKQALFERGSPYAKVEDIPDHAVKTTLQKVIQLLKRHRDTMFADDAEHKPISILITTLAALSYNNETSLVEALTSILAQMDSHIEDIDGVKWVRNPVNPDENFADKWAEIGAKERNFYKWLDAVRRDFGIYIRASTPADIPETLAERMGEAVVRKISDAFPKPEKAAPAVLAAPDVVSRTSEMAERVRQRGTESAPWCSEG